MMLRFLGYAILAAVMTSDVAYTFTIQTCPVGKNSLSASVSRFHRSSVPAIPPSRALRSATKPRCSADQATSQRKYELKETRKDFTVVLPIDDSIRGKDVECAITKTCLLLGVRGERIIDAELWAAVKPDDSYWEIDSHGGRDRCVIIRRARPSLAPPRRPLAHLRRRRPCLVCCRSVVLACLPCAGT